MTNRAKNRGRIVWFFEHIVRVEEVEDWVARKMYDMEISRRR